MKQAVIQTGGKQYMVKEGQELDVELLGDVKKLELEPLLVFDEKKVDIGTPTVKAAKVSAEVIDPLIKGEKIKIIKFKAKKRVKKQAGHRQKYTRIKITKITA
jgi:large subunit ribosomal protein L21